MTRPEPPDGPTDVVYLVASGPGRGATTRVCWATREEAVLYAQRQGLRGWRLEPCTHLPAPREGS